MDVAREFLKLESGEHALVIANHQTKGRGKWGRRWYSEYGKSILFTMVLPDRQFLSAYYSSHTFYMFPSVGVIRILQLYTQEPLYIKKPNDILCNNRKLAGILVEPIIRRQNSIAILVGVGIDLCLDTRRVNIDGCPQDIISMAEISSKAFNPSSVVADLVKEIEKCCEMFRTEDSSRRSLYEEWKTWQLQEQT